MYRSTWNLGGRNCSGRSITEYDLAHSSACCSRITLTLAVPFYSQRVKVSVRAKTTAADSPVATPKRPLGSHTSDNSTRISSKMDVDQYVWRASHEP